jgi:hypothetical protein
MAFRTRQAQFIVRLLAQFRMSAYPWARAHRGRPRPWTHTHDGLAIPWVAVFVRPLQVCLRANNQATGRPHAIPPGGPRR